MRRPSYMPYLALALVVVAVVGIAVVAIPGVSGIFGGAAQLKDWIQKQMGWKGVQAGLSVAIIDENGNVIKDLTPKYPLGIVASYSGGSNEDITTQFNSISNYYFRVIPNVITTYSVTSGSKVQLKYDIKWTSVKYPTENNQDTDYFPLSHTSQATTSRKGSQMAYSTTTSISSGQTWVGSDPNCAIIVGPMRNMVKPSPGQSYKLTVTCQLTATLIVDGNIVDTKQTTTQFEATIKNTDPSGTISIVSFTLTPGIITGLY